MCLPERREERCICGMWRRIVRSRRALGRLGMFRAIQAIAQPTHCGSIAEQGGQRSGDRKRGRRHARVRRAIADDMCTDRGGTSSLDEHSVKWPSHVLL